MPVVREGDIFPTLKDFKKALRQWAIEGNWTPHILDSDSHRVRAGCRSSKDCPFRIRVNFSDKRKNAVVTTCDDVHNCHASRGGESASHQNIKRAEAGKLRFLMEAVPRLLEVTMATNVQEIIDAVEKKYGQRIPTRQAQKVKSGLAPKLRVQCQHCQKFGHVPIHCPELLKPSTNSTPDFSIDATVDDSIDTTGAEQHSEPGAHSDQVPERQIDNGNHTTTKPAERDTRRQNPQAARKVRAHGKQSLPAIDPSLTNGYQPIRVIQQSSADPDVSRTSPQHLGSDHAPPTTAPTSKSAAEIRTEAAKLMQSAAVLMEQAAKMNAEAARLNLLVAND